MSFILDAQRRVDCAQSFESYREYLASKAASFPPSAYKLATADWYFDPREHRCPHDSWLESIAINDTASDENNPPSIKIRLLAAYRDGFIEFHYPRVFRYNLSYEGDSYGHMDWRYDEFRLSDNGHVLHEIEWCGAGDTGLWLIEASDVIHSWIPD
jgi:hypothetical protein